MNNSFVETLVGAVVIAVAGLFLFYAYSVAGVPSRSGYEVFGLFSRVDGINIGSDVRIAGIKVGTVTGLALDPKRYQAKVTLNIGSSYQVPDDSQARIATEGLLGGSYIGILPGGSETYLKPGQEIAYTQGTIDVFSLISQAITGMGGKKDDKGSSNEVNTKPATPTP